MIFSGPVVKFHMILTPQSTCYMKNSDFANIILLHDDNGLNLNAFSGGEHSNGLK